MTTANGPVYVMGAAGRQGGAALEHLRALGHEAGALFAERDARRNHDPRWNGPGTGTARFDQPDALRHTFHGAAAIVLTLEDPDTGPAERLRHGRTIIDAAVDAGVGHIVFMATTGPDHHRLSCDVSAEIAHYLEATGAPATVLRPATFMEEVPWYWLNRYGRDLVLTTPFPADAHLPLVALDDMGALAALAVERPDDFLGRSVDVAGDTRTPLDIAARLAAGLAEKVRYQEVQVEGVFVYQEASTHVSGIDRLRSLYPGLRTFSDWLEEGGMALCRRAVGPALARTRREAA